MIGFCDLHYAVKSFFLVVTFVAVCSSLCLLPRVFSRKKLMQKLLVPPCFVLSGAMLILFAAQVKSAHPAWKLTPIIESVTALPVILPILLLLAVIAVLLTIVIKERQFEKNAITRSSVKESLDYLNTGLCFAYKNGMVMLINHRMNNLSHTIFGRDLQNANAFWDNLSNGEIQSDVTRLSLGENPTFRLPDQTVWTFAREVLGGITQLWLQYSDYLRIIDDDVIDYPSYYVMTCRTKYPEDLPGIFDQHADGVLAQHSDDIAALRTQTAAYVTKLQQWDRYLPLTRSNMMRYICDNRSDIVGTIVDNLTKNMLYLDWVYDLLSGMLHGVYNPYQPVAVALPSGLDPELLSAMTTVTYAVPCRPVRDKVGDNTYRFMPTNPTQDLCISLLNAQILGSGRIKVAIDIRVGIWRSVYARLDAIKMKMSRKVE